MAARGKLFSAFLTLATLLPEAAAAQPIRLAVAPFANRTGKADRDALAKGLADMLLTDLAVSEDFVLVERERLQELVAEMKLGRSGLVDRRSARKIGRLLGAELILMGTMNSLDPALRLDARLVSVESGEVMATAAARGRLADFFKVENELATKLLKAFGVRLSPLVRMKVGRAPTRNLAAIRAYSRGLDASDRGDGRAAKAAFAEALAADPAFSRARARLKALEKRVEQLERRTAAVERAGGLILKPRTAIEHWSNARVHLSRGNRTGARAAMRAALAVEPGLDVLIALERLRSGESDPAPASCPKGMPARICELVTVPPARARRLAVQGRPVRGRPWDLAWLWLTARALLPGSDGRITAIERSLLSARVRALSEGLRIAPRGLRGAIIDPAAEREIRDFARVQRRYFDAPVFAPTLGPEFSVRRAALLSRPVVVSYLPGSRARRGPAFKLRVAIAAPGASECAVAIDSGRELKLRFLGVQPMPDELSVFEAPAPHPLALGRRPVLVRYTDRRGTARERRLTAVFSGQGRNPGRRVADAPGQVHRSEYPNAGTGFATFSEADAGGRLLVDPVGVWTVADKGRNRFDMPVIRAGLPTVFATGRAELLRHAETGTRFGGITRRLVYRVGGRTVFDGLGRYGVSERRGRRRWVSAAQSSAGLEGSVPLFEWTRRDRPPVQRRAATREVTVDEYRACVRAGACQPLLGATCAYQNGRRWGPDFGGDQATGCLPVRPNPYPVTGVLRRQAEAYCKWRGGHLPTFREWRALAAKADPAGDNFLDALTCEWTRWGRKARACDPAQLAPKHPWDGYGWIAPAGYSRTRPATGTSHLLGNVAEWVSDGGARGRMVAGCTWNQAYGPRCRQERKLDAYLDASVGFRCLGARGRAPTAEGDELPEPGRRKPKLDWAAIPAGVFVYGGSRVFEKGSRRPVHPVVHLPKASRDERDKVFARLVGVPRKAFDALVDHLARAGVRAEPSSHHLQELFSRARSSGLSAGRAIAAVLRGDRKPDLLHAGFGLYVNAGYAIERARRRKGAALSAAERATAIFARILEGIGRHYGAPRRRGGPRWSRDRGFSCALQTAGMRRDGVCVDRTGIRGARLDHERHESRRVEVGAFELMRTEVTRTRFREVMGYDPSFHACEDCPVERVTRGEAATFCHRVGGHLPTEAQWEWAATGGRKGREGEVYGPLDAIARWRGNSRGPGRVGARRANGFGLHDMLGGVWEWTADVFEDADDAGRALRTIRVVGRGGKHPGRAPSVQDLLDGRRVAPAGKACLHVYGSARRVEANLAELPWRRLRPRRDEWLLCFPDARAAIAGVLRALGRNPRGPRAAKIGEPQRRVIRGGSWGSDERFLNARSRVAYRQDMRNAFVGFRCAR